MIYDGNQSANELVEARLAVNDWHDCSTSEELARWRAAQARLIIAAKASVYPEVQALKCERDQLAARLVICSQWQPIGSEPKDGRWLLGWHEDLEYFVWRNGKGLISGEDPEPSHWMLIPNPPKPETPYGSGTTPCDHEGYTPCSCAASSLPRPSSPSYLALASRLAEVQELLAASRTSVDAKNDKIDTLVRIHREELAVVEAERDRLREMLLTTAISRIAVETLPLPDPTKGPT